MNRGVPLNEYYHWQRLHFRSQSAETSCTKKKHCLIKRLETVEAFLSQPASSSPNVSVRFCIELHNGSHSEKSSQLAPHYRLFASLLNAAREINLNRNLHFHSIRIRDIIISIRYTHQIFQLRLCPLPPRWFFVYCWEEFRSFFVPFECFSGCMSVKLLLQSSVLWTLRT